jgi:CheY-like chemotaxis protein/HAMP domain-containing protein
MSLLNRLSIGTRLVTGFGVVLLLVFGLGIVGERGISNTGAYVRDIYDHPYAVGKAIREIETHFYGMQFAVRVFALATQPEKRAEALRSFDQHEEQGLQAFLIVEDRYLGDRERVMACKNAFIGLRQFVDRIDECWVAEEPERIEAITGESSAYFIKALPDFTAVKEYGNNKAAEFYDKAENLISRTRFAAIVLLCMSLIIGCLISLMILFSIVEPLKRMVAHVSALSEGDLRTAVEIEGTDEIARLALTLQTLQSSLLAKLKVAENISEGDYASRVPVESDKDELAMTMNVMTETLSNLHATNQKENWLRSGINYLNDAMRGDKELPDLCRIIVTTLSKYIGAQVGVIYLKNQDQVLHLMGSYSFTHRNGINDGYKLGEGLVGQVALEKEIISLTELPKDYLKVTSGLGAADVRNVVLVPLLFNDELVGVIELGAMQKMTEEVINFLRESANIIAITIRSSESRTQLGELLLEMQQKTVELESQQEELRVTNEQLQHQTRKLKDSEAELQLQQEELATTNEELEEKNQYLEKHKTEINLKNQNLEKTRMDLEQKARDLEITSRYKSEFLANMSHELRTPLNSLLILSKDLMDNTDGNLNAEQIESAGIIYKGGNELLSLINDILDLSRIEAGKLTMHIEAMDLDACLNGLIRRFSPLAKEKSITLSMQRGDDLPKNIQTDVQRFTQIITNLLSNAVKFTHEGKVNLRADRCPGLESEMLRIQISDTGIGIPKEKEQEIFEAFQQVDGSISRRYGGSGLGLSITRQLCALLNATISVQSEVGAGSTFTLTIPIEHTEVSKPSAQVEPVAKTAIDQKKSIEPAQSIEPVPVYPSIEDDRAQLAPKDRALLVIEDDLDFAGVLRKMAHKRGFRFLHAPTGEVGIALAREYEPSAIILDIYLPEMQGWEVLDALKENEKTRHIPVHMMSAQTESIDALRKGAIGFLQKPVSSEQLSNAFSKIEGFIEKEIKDLLLIEDDADLQKILVDLIAADDVLISVASTGQEALDLLASRPFDCVILDMSLPDMSGLELLKALKEIKPTELPPVIIHTGQPISKELEFELQSYSETIIIKGASSTDRLLDETALFLHQVIENLPDRKRDMILRLHDSDRILEGKKVLLVDDDMRNVFALSKLLANKHMTVIKAVNGEKALEALEANPDVDIILMDVMMPVMDGLEATRRIRKMRPFEKTPIICVTAKAMKDDRQKCIDAGANDYVTKPVEAERLFSVIRVWLHK